MTIEFSDQDDDSVRVLALNKRTWHHSKSGGAELNLERSLKGLAEKGHEIHLLTGSDENRPKKDIDQSVHIKRIGINHRFSSPWDVVVAYLTISIYFYWWVYRLSPDIIYAVNSPLPWPVITRRKKITIFHHIAIDSFYETHPFPQNVLGSLTQWIGVYRERANPSVSVSPSTTKELVSRGHKPETIYEIKNGLDLKKFSPGNKSAKPRIVYVGGLEKYKGVDKIPTIHQKINQMMDQPVFLDVAGKDGPLCERIKSYCDKNTNARFHGFVSHEKKVELLQSAWVFIAPSRVEGWGIAILEANACGTPAVGSNVSGLQDSIRTGETGLLANEENPELFAQQVTRLLTNTEERNELANRAQVWANKHSWEQTIDSLDELIRSISSND
ncbi:glycosyltransferase family 4 protein [Haladaptatus sp. CMAA 1911]|uniref:glycosyltransferase family 4 protein n=1 Tax=unclassified Haladaptatus TaxID=2622732 RepID=UPI0037553381